MSLSARAQFTPRGDLGRFVDVVIKPGVEASVQAACQLIEDRAKELVPVDAGDLQSSIHSTVQETGKTIVGTVGTDLYYGPYVEFGTGIAGSASPGAGPGPYTPGWPGMPAQPYMRPATDEARGAILDLFRSNISVAI